jgi:hypothetical protein
MTGDLERRLDDIVREASHYALREARRNHLSIFNQALKKHREHQGFRAEQWPREREMGFSCLCSEPEADRVLHTFRISLVCLKEMEVRARISFLRLFPSHHRPPRTNRQTLPL